MVTNYFATSLSSQTIDQVFGKPETNYSIMKTTALGETNIYFSIGISFIALMLFIRAFSR